MAWSQPLDYRVDPLAGVHSPTGDKGPEKVRFSWIRQGKI